MEEMELWDDGIRLHVKIDFPKAEAAGGKYPMCIVLHGFTGDMEERHIVAVQEAMNEIGMATLRVELYGHGSSGGEFAVRVGGAAPRPTQGSTARRGEAEYRDRIRRSGRCGHGAVRSRRLRADVSCSCGKDGRA